MVEIEVFLAFIPLFLGVWALFRGTGVFLFYFLLLTACWPEGISYEVFGYRLGYARVFPITVILLYLARFVYGARLTKLNSKMLIMVGGYLLAVFVSFFFTSSLNFFSTGYFPFIFLKSAVFSLWVGLPFLFEASSGRLNLLKQNLVSQTAWMVGIVFLLVSPQSVVFYLKYSDSLWRVRQGSEFVEHVSHLVVFYFNEVAVFFFTLAEESSMLFSIFSSALVYFLLKGVYLNRTWAWLGLLTFLFVITINQYLKMVLCFYIQVALFPVIYLLQSRIRFGRFSRLKLKKTIILFLVGIALLPTALETRQQRLGQHEAGRLEKIRDYIVKQFELEEYTREDGSFYIFAQKLRNRSGWVDQGGNKGGNRLSRIQITFDRFLKKPFFGYGLTHPSEQSRREMQDPFLSGVSYLVDHLYIFGIFGGLASYLFMLVGPFYFLKKSFYRLFSMQETYFLISFWVIAFFMSVVGFIPRNASSKSLIHFFNLWIICRYFLLSSELRLPKFAQINKNGDWLWHKSL